MKVIFIAVHPDDETLGCGGTIFKHKGQKDDLFWMILTNMPKNSDLWNGESQRKRKEEIEAVKKKYGFKKTYQLDYDTTTLDEIPRSELIKKIADIFKDIKPDILYIPNRSDVHSDHRAAFKCIMSAGKIFNHPYIKKIYMYECVSETEQAPALSENAFMPNYFVEISKYIDKKIDILKLFESEIKDHPFPRSEKTIKALAAFRGAQAGVEYAEGFMILRDIWK